MSLDPPAQTVTWLQCPECHKAHVVPPMARFTCPCGRAWWYFRWHRIPATGEPAHA